MDSNSIRELNLEEMNKVSGGVQKTVVTGSATVRSGAGTNYPVCRTLGYNTVVNFTGTVIYNEQEGRSWYKINSPVTGWVLGREIGIDV
jgi:hypothetical protein